jgi:hypothetical protein
LANDTVLDVLKRARERLSRPGAWTKGTYAREADGTESLGWCPEIEVCWCAFGALRAENAALSQDAAEFLSASCPDGLNLHQFNDACDRVEQVLEVYDLAIAKASP